MDKALDAAITAEAPGLPTMFQDVYAPGTPGPQPQAARLAAILGESA